MNPITNRIAEAKAKYHKNLAGIPFEEKVKIIVELQKIDAEMNKKNPGRAKAKYKMIWQIPI